MRILIVSDAWYPQVNGVVRTMDRVIHELTKKDHQICVISPSDFKTIPCPTYPEIRLALFPGRRMGRLIRDFNPDAIHVATEGPLGLCARQWCLRNDFPFTSAFHTKFPEYVHARWRIPLRWTYAMMRWFHKPSRGVMVATQSVRRELQDRGFQKLVHWTRGVDTDLFQPLPPGGQTALEKIIPSDILALPRPIFTYVGRVAVEKNIEAFLSLELPGSKLVIGDGPQMTNLKNNYSDVRFVGAKHGEDLARYFALGDVFVFPSKTDTFGLVVLEALASGLPVAAYPVSGPLDIFGATEQPVPDIVESDVGVLSTDLQQACLKSVGKRSQDCIAHAHKFSWEMCALMFLENLQIISDTGATDK